MALKPREKRLAVITAVLLVVAVGYYLLSFLSGPIAVSRARRAGLQKEVKDKRDQLDRIQTAFNPERSAKLAEWRRGALAGSPVTAASDYQDWLSGLCARVGLTDANVAPKEPQPHRGDFDSLPFSVSGRANLEQVTKFLYEFYSDPRLHRIRTLTLKPLAKSSDLDVRMAIEAVVLREKGAKKLDGFRGELAQAPKEGEGSDADRPASRWLAESKLDLDDYRERIVGRNLFAAYQPPAPPREEVKIEPPKFDPSRFAFLTAIVAENDRPEAWMIARTTGKKHVLREGDTFEVGELRGKVLQINHRDAEIEIDGQRWLFPIGDNLRDAVKLSDG